ncbi:MAG: hypothetical protein HY821_00965 [Acidobacteria bacterium]|nr:hypothetical protein [Acidobacteriota bacterium]
MKLIPVLLLTVLAAAGAPATPGLEEIRKEADGRKRFDLAIGLAENQALAARQLVRDSGSRTDLEKMLADVTGGCDLALESLRSLGVKPSKLGKQYKKGEVKSRDIERLLGDIALALSIDDRPLAEKARDQVAVIHEEFLLGVMDK